jgi:hypothetical protein
MKMGISSDYFLYLKQMAKPLIHLLYLLSCTATPAQKSIITFYVLQSKFRELLATNLILKKKKSVVIPLCFEYLIQGIYIYYIYISK